MIVVVVTLSLVFPKINKNIVNTRNRSIATYLASASLENLKKKPYDLLDVTDPALFQIATPNCNCQTDNFSTMLSTTSLQASGMTFDIRTCVHYVVRAGGDVWNSRCPSSGDTGYKDMLVRVRWTQGSETYTVSQTSFKTAY